MPGTWLTITDTLNRKPAATGWQNHLSVRYTRPRPIECPEQPLGRRQQGQRRQKYESIMCCNMCPE